MKEFLQLLLGDQAPQTFGVLLFYALFGAALSLLLHTTERDPNSNRTPDKFCWKFFFRDNWKRIVTGIMMIGATLRFTPELFGIEISEFWALVIGLSHDRLAQLIKDKTNLLGQKKAA